MLEIKRMKAGFDEFEVGDLVLTKDKTEAYIIIEVKKCSCCCHCDKTERLKLFYILSGDFQYRYSSDYTGEQREIARAVLTKKW